MGNKIRTRQAPTRFSRSTYEAPTLVGGGKAKPVEEMLLFSYQETDDDGNAVGEPEEFYSPTRVTRQQSNDILEVYAQHGEVVCTVALIKMLVGDRGYEILSDEDKVTEDNYKTIVSAAYDIVTGPGKSGSRG
jgi:hypothetical protein